MTRNTLQKIAGLVYLLGTLDRLKITIGKCKTVSDIESLLNRYIQDLGEGSVDYTNEFKEKAWSLVDQKREEYLKELSGLGVNPEWTPEPESDEKEVEQTKKIKKIA